MNIRSNRRVALGLATILILIGIWWVSVDDCVSTWLFQGVKTSECPDGNLRQTVTLEARNLTREAEGFVIVGANGHGVTGSGAALQAPVRRIEPGLFLVDAEGRETPLAVEKGWERQKPGFAQGARVKLPALPDGDYRLRARVTSPLGTDTVDAPLAFYAPARIQVLTDRPLYEPGHGVRFRALVLRARDLSPLEGRPGTWFVKDPSGEVVMEQRMPAGSWGVTSGEFPLDRGAPLQRLSRRAHQAGFMIGDSGHLQRHQFIAVQEWRISPTSIFPPIRRLSAGWARKEGAWSEGRRQRRPVSRTYA